VPKDQKLANALDARSHLSSLAGTLGKKRKLQRDGLGLGGESMDMRVAMGMAMDLGLADEDEDEHLLTMTDEQMVSYLAQYETDFRARVYRYRRIPRGSASGHVRPEPAP
jgi:hypothetical protein